MDLDVPPPMGPLFIFGIPFLQKFFTVYDHSSKQVGFALAKHIKGEEDEDSDDVQQFFEVRFQEHSFSLHQVAVFTATLESFVQSETRERLEATYGALGLSPTATNATEEQLNGVIEGYMAMYVVGYNYSNVSPRIMRNMRKRIIEVYPTWEATKNWSLAVRRELLEARATNVHAEGPSLASFEFSMKILEEIGDRYGRWQNR